MNASRMIETGRLLEKYEQRQQDSAKVTLSRLAWYVMIALSTIGLSSVLFYVISIIGG